MIIEKTTAYKVGQQCFSCMAEAQLSALENALAPLALEAPEKVAGLLLDNAEAIIGILEMKESKSAARKPRSDKGKPRSKTSAVAAAA